MIRHSQSYLFGAISGTAVIAAAVVFFVLFVSAQALRDWPIGDLSIGGGNDSTAVSPAQSLGGSAATNAAAANLSGPITGTPANVAARGESHRRRQPQGFGQRQRERARSPRDQDRRRPRGRLGAGPAAFEHLTNPRADGREAAPRPPAREQLRRPPAAATAPPPGPARTRARPPSSGNVGTKTARRVTNTVNEISSAATPPAPSPVTNTVSEVAERVEQTPPPSGNDAANASATRSPESATSRSGRPTRHNARR